jgi:hypothetical protein
VFILKNDIKTESKIDLSEDRKLRKMGQRQKSRIAFGYQIIMRLCNRNNSAISVKRILEVARGVPIGGFGVTKIFYY